MAADYTALIAQYNTLSGTPQERLIAPKME